MQSQNDKLSGIPVIDIRNEDSQTGEQLIEAVSTWGFVFVRGPGLGFSAQAINDVFQLVRPHALQGRVGTTV